MNTIITNRNAEILTAWLSRDGVLHHDYDNPYGIHFAIGLNYDEEQSKKAAEIQACKQMLKETDYQAIKFSDNALTEEEYAPIRAQRASWRARINEIEKDFVPPSITREEMDVIERSIVDQLNPEEGDKKP